VSANNGGNENRRENELDSEHRLEDIQSKVDLIVLELKDLKEAKKLAETSAEKKMIRQEVRKLNGELNALYAEGKKVSGGIYIGSSALIVILILLLLL
jgi:cell division protein FtsB